MRFPPLHEAVLLRRYKRFLADIRLPDGSEVTAHCPNPGRMTACWAPNIPCRVSHHPDPKRKLHWTLQQTCMDGHWVLVNTNLPNRIVREALEAEAVPELRGYASLRTEVKLGSSRIDLHLSDPERPTCWVEVKNVTLVDEDGVLRFPDAVSARATKHLAELVECVQTGERAVLFFHVGRADGAVPVEPASKIDPTYAAALATAVDQGVEVLAYRGILDADEARLGERLPVLVPGSRRLD